MLRNLLGVHVGALFFREAFLLALNQILNVRQNTRERYIHAFYNVGQLDVVLALLGQLLDIVARRWIVRETDDARKSIEAVTDSNVKGLTEDPVSFLAVRDDLRVATRDVEHGWILGFCSQSTHLYMADAMVHADERLLVHESEGARNEGTNCERLRHSWTLSVHKQIDLLNCEFGFVESILY